MSSESPAFAHLADSSFAAGSHHFTHSTDEASLSHIFAHPGHSDDGDLLPLISAVERPAGVGEPEVGSNLYVAGLPTSVDDDALRATFAAFGSVISAKVMLSVETSRSRGFGFVLFEKAANAEAAKSALHGKGVPNHGGRMQITVSKHRGENLAVESKVVYTRNIPATVTADMIAEYCFSVFGDKPRVTSRHPVAKAGDSPSFRAFILEFSSVEVAKSCVAGLHGKLPFPECTNPVLAKLEEPQALREKRLKGKPEASSSPGSQNRTPSHTTTPVPGMIPAAGDPLQPFAQPSTITVGNRTIVLHSPQQAASPPSAATSLTPPSIPGQTIFPWPNSTGHVSPQGLPGFHQPMPAPPVQYIYLPPKEQAPAPQPQSVVYFSNSASPPGFVCGPLPTSGVRSPDTQPMYAPSPIQLQPGFPMTMNAPPHMMNVPAQPNPYLQPQLGPQVQFVMMGQTPSPYMPLPHAPA